MKLENRRSMNEIQKGNEGRMRFTIEVGKVYSKTITFSSTIFKLKGEVEDDLLRRNIASHAG